MPPTLPAFRLKTSSSNLLSFAEKENPMRTRATLFALCLGILLTGTASAQIVKKAQVGFRFLENPISAEIIGRGAAGVTVVTDANAAGIFWNPALIGWNTA